MNQQLKSVAAHLLTLIPHNRIYRTGIKSFLESDLIHYSFVRLYRCLVSMKTE